MVHFNVNFKNFNSFVDITLSMAKTLTKLGIPVSVEQSEIAEHALRIFTEDEKTLLADWMSRTPSDLFQLKWSHYWKPLFLKELNGHLNLEFFAINYEFARQNEEFDYWIQDVVGNSSHKLATSEFCKNVLIKSGCPPANVSVMPLGFNPLIAEQYRPKSFKSETDLKSILHMTNSFDLYRFGTDILIQAFCQEFRNDSSVELIVKDGGNQSNLILELIAEVNKKVGNFKPTIKVKGKVVTKQELADLYLSADAFVAPFRGEGFGIKVLDAFAAGLPVAIPLYSGPTDYANTANCYPIAYDVVPVGKCYDTEYLVIRNSPHWAEPNIASLREQLRKIVEDPMRYQVGKKAKETADQFSWEASTHKLLKLMRQLF
ncbi:MAG TPA: glycosyltransferase family 4 protein [Kamptonema sp.]|nr:glycosyltransferase family 4 protein [Kamptonema sp.]